MSKRVRYLLIGCGLLAITFFVILYFIITRNSHFPYVYFSTESATDQWISDSEKVLLEYQDEHFYIYWDDNGNIVSLRKDTAFWVVHRLGSSVGTNSVYSATVKGDLYLYGTTKKADVQSVKLVDFVLNEIPSSFFGKRIESVDALFFCIKIPKDTFIGLSSRLVFLDSNDNIVSEQPKEESLLEPFLKTVDPAQQVVNQPEIKELGSSSLSELRLQQFHLDYENTNDYTLQEYTERLTMYFLDDYVLLINQKGVTSYYQNEVQTSYYDTTYKLEYTEELLDLKKKS